MSGFFVYAIACQDGSVYIGQSDDLGRRWTEHLVGRGADWTRDHPPVALFHWERFDTRDDAVEREKTLKGGSGREWLKRVCLPRLHLQQNGQAEVRFIEVKGRSGVGEVALSANEYRTAERLKQDYWLYVVFNCLPAGQAGGTTPELHTVQDPAARLGWKPVVQVAHYHVVAGEILSHSQKSPKEQP